MEEQISEVLQYYEEKRSLIEPLLRGVETFFQSNRRLQSYIHTVNTRMKNPSHLEDKIRRKAEKGTVITKNNLFSTVTDLAGVRVLHLYPKQFDIIHEELMKAINEDGLWKLYEKPVAYTWDPETANHFADLELRTEVRDTYYTSIHYVIRPNNQIENAPCCEIQVRTLFEEIWGEIDHHINYPHPTNILACKEQLRVLAKLVSTGTRLADAIYSCYDEYQKKS
jgi:ppGpp synthetase/RelA/SpoT-type nucleotidyltranferase